jgi:hypothetical protein
VSKNSAALLLVLETMNVLLRADVEWCPIQSVKMEHVLSNKDLEVMIVVTHPIALSLALPLPLPLALR